jgi:lipopolysaccharide transport system ATP-binding protein
MSDIAIRVQNLGKMYRIGGRQAAQETFRDMIAHIAAEPFRRVRNVLRGQAASTLGEDVWVLKDLTFEINHGDVVGIIGRNGAGKSTLLKILSSITEPTSGYADIYGRVGALLEVGTGFHPELTGRENVFLNGAILGMSRGEIKRKFDEIVEFAGVEQFIDTPVKHYSSGMGLRLGFAVAAHLEPDILIVDEVLAVGDAEFQKKCLGKMGDVAQQGRTVLFVSHHMGQIRRLCQQCIWLDNGAIRKIDQTMSTVSAYEASMVEIPGNASQNGQDLQFVDWRIADAADEDAFVLNHMNEVTLNFSLHSQEPRKNLRHGLVLYSADNRIVWSSAADNIDLKSGVNVLSYRLTSLPLVPGVYHWFMTIVSGDRILTNWYPPQPLLIETDEYTHPYQEWRGMLNTPWTFERL